VKSDWRRWLFYFAGIYDGLFGLIFFFFWPQLYAHFRITPPNHDGYVRFPALLLIIFGFMFLQIARDPERNRNLIAYGIALKVAYAGLVFWYQLTTPGIPSMWIPWAWCDLGFIVLFSLALRRRMQ
jgi:hypothetical protein